MPGIYGDGKKLSFPDNISVFFFNLRPYQVPFQQINISYELVFS